MGKTKLELTWIGKWNRPQLEPRILLSDPSRSHHANQRLADDDIFDNRLIFGDNLLALKALEMEFAGRVRCIYIDPPYNTGSAFEHYDDGVEHSVWLSLIKERLEILWRLLTTDGSIWISIDDREGPYLRVLLDEVCGRRCFVAQNVWQKRYSRDNNSAIGDVHEYVVVYAKDPELFKLARNKIELDVKNRNPYKNPNDDPRGAWQSISLTGEGFRPNQMYKIIGPDGTVHVPPEGRHWGTLEPEFQKMRDGGRIWFGKDGKGVPRLIRYLSEVEGLVPWTWWPHEDVGHTDEAKKESQVLFGKDRVFPTPKPERLIRRILEIATRPGELVLDSFAGSGTTGAVAQKMRRRWIMVELGEHCHTHIVPRMKKVIDGSDPGGVTEATGWKGGGGFRYYRLAPSLLEKDRFDNWIISKQYNAAMLAEAMCKLEGFAYAPSSEMYWQQGRSTERDFIYVTTQTFTREMLAKLSDEVGEDRSLLICCGAFRSGTTEFPNLTLKKIPKAVMSRCEWGKDDYSLQIAALPKAEPSDEPDTPAPPKLPAGEQRKRRKARIAEPSLFGNENGGSAVNRAILNLVANRLSLRPPQRESLEILSEVCDLIPMEKGADPAAALASLRAKYPQVEDFEREFPSLCFSLATGVGKTRLMGAFITYLHKAEGIRHFFVLAPNLTIYNKLIADFTPNTPKYVFQGISDFALNPPEIVTGDTYEDGRGVRGDVGVPLRQGRLFDPTASGAIHVNIFNISKINSEVRGDKQPRIKRLHEYIGESYFEYLSKLDDLVLLMDESHRYRASAGVKAINELKPILGLELTATPQVESGKGSTGFKNVIYSYPLSAALNDGFVKEPAVATRENFDARAYDEEGLERLKLEDGVRVHEEAKTQLDVYARDFGARRMKPFMLVVAKDITHANEIVKLIESDEFFDGQYKPAPEGPKVISVHSQAKSEEKDDIVQQLLTVEDPNNSVEIVVHVNMLKEGWDVTNLYTIVPLRTANSRTLVEQSIGRGLRLPYGKRTGVAAVDRLTIISHDKFQEIIDHANDPNSIIRKGVIIGRDIPDTKSKVVVIESNVAQRLGLQSIGTGAQQKQPTLFVKPEEQRAAQVTYQVLRQFERLPSSADLRKPDVQQKIVEQVKAAIAAQGGTQSEFEQFKAKVDFAQVVAKTVDLHIDMSIDIPRIVVVPTGEVTSGFTDFDLDVSPIHLQPVKQRVLIQNLGDGQRYTLETGASVAVEEKLEDYIVRGLMDYPDINYDEHAELMYKLAGQAVAHLKSYLKDEEDVLNVLLVHQRLLVQSVYAQMEAHYVEKAPAYEVHVSKGFTTMRPVNGTTAEDEVRDYRAPVDEKKNIRGMLFGGFSKCLYQVQKFDSDTERRLASIFEKDKTVLKWCKPPRDALKIDYARGEVYEPDFVVETDAVKFICESKSSDEMHASAVEAKARAAATWCDHATKHGGGKPWKYLLIPHEKVDDAKTLAGLAGMYTVSF